MALVNNYTIEFSPIPCEIGSEQWKLTLKTDANLNELMPYLNGYFKKRVYDPNSNTFVFTFEGHRVSLHDNLIMIARINNQEEGKELAKKVVDFLNKFNEMKNEITPDYERHEPPKPMEIYKFLPKTNCKKCGEPSCFVFATKLSQGDHEITDCPELTDEQKKELEKYF